HVEAVPVELPDVARDPRTRIVLGVRRPRHEPSGEELRVVHERQADHVEPGCERQAERGEQHRPHRDSAHARGAAGRPRPAGYRRARDRGAHALPPSGDSSSTYVCTRAIDSTSATRITATAEAMPMWLSSNASR